MPKYFVYGTPSKNTFVWKMPVVLCVMGIKEELVLVISCNMSAWEEFTNACWAGTFNSSFHREKSWQGRESQNSSLQRWFLWEKVGDCGLIALLRRIKKGFWYFVTFHNLHCLFF